MDNYNVNINACEACNLRYQSNDINQLNNCCFETCAQLIGSEDQSDIIQSKCGQNCLQCAQKNVFTTTGKTPCFRKLAVPPLYTHRKDFLECQRTMPSNPLEDVLSCCLSKARNHADEERCIDAYNALTTAKEGFKPQHGHYVEAFNFSNFMSYKIGLFWVLLFLITSLVLILATSTKFGTFWGWFVLILYIFALFFGVFIMFP